MSTIRVNTIVDASGSGPVDFETIDSLKLGANGLVLNDSAGAAPHVHKMIDSSGAPFPSADSGAYNGLMWDDSANERINVWVPVGWRTFGATKPVIPPAYFGSTIINAGGDQFNAGNVVTIDYFSYAAGGANATDFGDLTVDYSEAGSASNGTIMVVFGGRKSGVAGITDMDQMTFSTPANATSFGTLDTSGWLKHTGVSDGTLCVYAGNRTNASVASRDIRYFPFDNYTTTTDFGDLASPAIFRGDVAGCGDGTYAVWAGGETQSGYYTDDIDYVTIQTPSNSTQFGSISGNARKGLRGCSDTTRGLHMGGFDGTGAFGDPRVDIIEYITIAVPSNATDFGNLTLSSHNAGVVSDGTYAFCCGGVRYIDSYYGSQEGNTIDYVTIQTPGNATDFGDLTTSVDDNMAESGN